MAVSLRGFLGGFWGMRSRFRPWGKRDRLFTDYFLSDVQHKNAAQHSSEIDNLFLGF